MQRQSPPKHRHDGTSPLPLGMDWSPPPRAWAGRGTVWPHDPRTGWTYCITIPSWIVLAKSRDSDPTVFYRVQVGIQSPEGVTTTRTVLRRFNDFLKLHTAIKRALPQKNLPPTPPKGLLRMKTRAMLEERRNLLEEWMSKLLSDIDSSRSIVVASFLELEAAARSAFQEESQHSSDSKISLDSSISSLHVNPDSNISAVAGSSSLTSDYGSDTAYETSEVGTPSLGKDNNSDIGTEDLSLDDDLTSPIDKFVKYGMSNIDEGLSMGHAILEQLEKLPKHRLQAREIHSFEQIMSNGSSSKSSHKTADSLELLSDPDAGPVVHHVRKLSNESVGSEKSSQRGSEYSSLGLSRPNGYRPLDLRNGTEVSGTIATLEDSDYQLRDDVHLVIPIDQRQKMNRILATMQQRLLTAKTDMEDLISRLNQEIAVKDYLATKVKDLEVELETTKQKSKENLEQAILIERERITRMQWDMEELRRTSMEMEMEMKYKAQKTDKQSTDLPVSEEKDKLRQELDATRQQFDDLLKRYQELEVKSKADIKILIKEVKSLRGSQAELKQQLNQSIEEKTKAEEFLQEEREKSERTRSYWRELLHKCKVLHDQLQDCSINKLTNDKQDDILVNIPSISNPLDLAAASDSQLSLLVAEAQNLARDVEFPASTTDRVDDEISIDELRAMLTTILIDNGVLRKQVNSLTVLALKMRNSLDEVAAESHAEENVQNEV